MQSEQVAASLPDLLDQISLAANTVATVPPTDTRLNLLSIPPEIRHNIYQYFLKYDKTADYDFKNDFLRSGVPWFFLCRQLRSEALEFFATNNKWIEFVYPSSHEARVNDEIWIIPRIPLPLLTNSERQMMLGERALTIAVTENDAEEKSAEEHVLFAYTAVSYAKVRDAVIILRNMKGLAASITIGTKYHDRNHTIVEDLILPFVIERDSMDNPRITLTGVQNSKLAGALVSGMNRVSSSARDVQERMLAFKEEGNNFFKKGHLKAAVTFYWNALEMFTKFHSNGSLENVFSPAEVNVIMSIKADVLNNIVHAWNVLAAESRDSAGLHISCTIPMIVETALFSRTMFNWCGVSEQQRQKAHHRCAVAMETLAEVCRFPEDVKYIQDHSPEALAMFGERLAPSDLLKIATHQYYYAWKADEHSSTAQFLKDRYQAVRTTHSCSIAKEPKLVTIRDVAGYKDGIWVGDRVFLQGQTSSQMRRDLESSIPRDNKAMTKKQLMKMKQDLGMPGGQTDGLLRLLRPDPNEDTTHNDGEVKG